MKKNHRSTRVSGAGHFMLVHSTNVICKVSYLIMLLGNGGVKNDVFVNAQGLCILYGWKYVPKCFWADNV